MKDEKDQIIFALVGIIVLIIVTVIVIGDKNNMNSAIRYCKGLGNCTYTNSSYCNDDGCQYGIVWNDKALVLRCDLIGACRLDET